MPVSFVGNLKTAALLVSFAAFFFGMSRMGERYVTSQTTAASLFFIKTQTGKPLISDENLVLF